MQPGELSGVIQVGDKYVILLCEDFTKPVVVDFSEVRGLLHEDILERKYRIEMAKKFESIIKRARVANHLDPSRNRPRKKDRISGRGPTAKGGRTG